MPAASAAAAAKRESSSVGGGGNSGGELAAQVLLLLVVVVFEDFTTTTSVAIGVDDVGLAQKKLSLLPEPTIKERERRPKPESERVKALLLRR